MPHAWAEIDLEAIRLNLLAIRSKLKPWVEVIGMVKGNGYGHGMVAVAEALLEAGAGRLGVAFTSEAVSLRNAGITAPILLVGSFTRGEVDDLVQHDVTPAVGDPGLAYELGAAARRRGRRMAIHVDVDTGMGRLGMRFEKVPALVEDLRKIEGIWIEGIFTHLSSADEDDQTYSRLQLRRFSGTLERMRERGVTIPYVHAQNSAGVFNLPDVMLQGVRPGLSLYGLYPSPACEKKALLRPALALRSRVVLVKQVPADTFVSYNRTYKTAGETNLATISAGYADGVPRLLSSKGRVLIRGRQYPIAGRVTMDHMVADLGADDDVKPGDRVTLIGRDGGEEITAEDVAAWAQTITYEVTCGITARVPRIYRRSAAHPEDGDERSDAPPPRVVNGRRW